LKYALFSHFRDSRLKQKSRNWSSSVVVFDVF